MWVLVPPNPVTATHTVTVWLDTRDIGEPNHGASRLSGV